MNDYALRIPVMPMAAYRALYGTFMDALIKVSREQQDAIVDACHGISLDRFMLALVESDGALRIRVFYETERPWLRVQILINEQWRDGIEVRHDALGVAADVIDTDQRLRMTEAIADLTEGAS